MNIDEVIRGAAAYYELDYLAAVAGEANVDLDNIKRDTLWQNITEDGQFAVDVYGHVSDVAHVQFMLLRPVGLDDDGRVWQEAKNALKEKAKNVAACVMLTGEELGLFTMNQEPAYECGYDKMDANLAYCLVDLYLRTTATCGETLTEEWIKSILPQ